MTKILLNAVGQADSYKLKPVMRSEIGGPGGI